MPADRKVKHIIQGEFDISEDPGVELATVLGSCVAACLHDPVRRIGGMNHFLLPGNDPNAGRNIKYGAHSMEELINAMLRAGAQRDRLHVQLFGGGNVVAGLGGIGERNASFARGFIRNEGLRLVGQDLGGTTGRRLRFVPTTGEARIVCFDTVEQALRAPIPPPQRTSTFASGDVDLF